MENAILCHICVTPWLCSRAVKIVQLSFFSLFLFATHTHTHTFCRDTLHFPALTVLSCRLAGRSRHIPLQLLLYFFAPRNLLRCLRLQAHADLSRMTNNRHQGAWHILTWNKSPLPADQCSRRHSSSRILRDELMRFSCLFHPSAIPRLKIYAWDHRSESRWHRTAKSVGSLRGLFLSASLAHHQHFVFEAEMLHWTVCLSLLDIYQQT